MASVDNVVLTISEREGLAFIEVSYKISGDERDVATRQRYRELVLLRGDDERPGEDGNDDYIPSGQIFHGAVIFGPSQTEFHRKRASNISADLLNEDYLESFQPDRTHEIRAEVSLSPLPPLPPKSARASSNVVHRSSTPGL